MKARIMLALLGTAAMFACQDERSAPLDSSPVTAVAPSVSVASSCPCWDSEALAGALPEANACYDQTTAEIPFLSVDLFDPSAATQTQAFTRYDAGTAEAGSCRLAVVGTEGLVAEISAATGLARSQYEACAALLAERARVTAAGC